MPSEVRFRSEQQAIVEGYEGGLLGIAAVPGSGKTFTLAHLAARLVETLTARGLSGGVERREVLIVTFTNTAVNSFRSKIAAILRQERGLLPYVGYQVRTLHSLARDIVAERPALAGLAEDFRILDEKETTRIIEDVVRSHLAEFEAAVTDYLSDEISRTAGQTQRVKQHELPRLASDLSLQFIKNAKNNEYEPATLRAALEAHRGDLPLVRFGLGVFEDYQRSLSYRGAVDFDDLVRLALAVLETDPSFCQRLQERWVYILEDEAQDSSRLQEKMLSRLSHGQNWVRVGDPNQAINTTFTTADPRFLTRFLDRRDVQARPLFTSGRSALPIIDLANMLVDWTATNHPERSLREAFVPQRIRPTAKNDPQPNPPPDRVPVYIYYNPNENVSPEAEIDLVASNVQQFVEHNPDYTVAVLVPENSRGYKLAEALKKREVDFEELLRSTSATRQAATLLRIALTYLSNPLNTGALVAVYREVWPEARQALFDQDDPRREVVQRLLAGCRRVEEYLWPVAGVDWLDSVDVLRDQPELRAELEVFRATLRLWLHALVLPIDQLVLTVSQDLFGQAPDIALGYKIGGVLRGLALSNASLRLPEFVQELKEISENQRKFIGFDDTEHGYQPEPGRVTVATMHAAKGLEWDRVYLLGVSNYGFPSAQEYDNYLAERWFVRDGLNLEAESAAQLNALALGETYEPGRASVQARYDYAAERLRLLYVGITRARRSLVITWNMGRYWDKGSAFVNRPALPLVAMAEYLRHGNSG